MESLHKVPMRRLGVVVRHASMASPLTPETVAATTASPTARRQALRAILQGKQVISPASVFDPLSAQMAQRTGYETVQLAGSVAANVALGAPDLMLLSLSEFAALVRRITRYCSLPLVVDADHGYGNALGAARCIEELEAAGVAGITLEDTQLPAGHGSKGTFIKGSAGGFLLCSPDEHRGKLLAAVAAKTDPSTVVIARTSSYVVGGIDELTKRVAAYRDTGVDAVHIIGQLEKAEFPALRTAAGDLPLMLSGPQNASKDELAGFGVRLTLSGHTPFLAAMKAAYDALKAGRGEGAKAPESIDQKDLADLLRVPHYMGIQKDLMNVEKPAEGMK
eukprot:gnl/TRDRNA2_/TRDRNA2_29008_c0_seq1.p1 gnl/TRDRNA2_/TRDRNA2_29008_c0~~gnl/TRDRNA2_/TRDRNA2_29008_c0_seq1.p1  ORF type:complete len:335 (-),score=78.92 gnl/TRDRNA2_/TRDRNA2_29008_c0_seq1:61-1065(-)